MKDEMIAALKALVPGASMPPPSNLKLLNWRTSQVVKGQDCVVSGDDPSLVLTGDWCYESSFEGCVQAAHSAVDVCFGSVGAKETTPKKNKKKNKKRRKRRTPNNNTCSKDVEKNK